jgi:hypothetical protein
MVFICASCNGEFKTLEEMEKHWQDLGIKYTLIPSKSENHSTGEK